MLNQNGGSKTDTLVKLVLVFFLSLLSFSVGTFVGKQFSDSQHKMAELEGGTGDVARSTASIPPDVTKAEPGKAISDEEVSKLNDEFIDKERGKEGAPTDAAAGATAKNKEEDEGTNALTGDLVGEDKKANAKKAEPAAAAKKAVSIHDEIASVSKKIASDIKLDAPKAKPSRIPSSLPPEVAGSAIGKYTVQISAQATEDDAKTKAADLKEKGFSAFYVPATVNGKTWYRVSVGQFSTRKEALDYRTDFLKKANIASAIVQKIGN